MRLFDFTDECGVTDTVRIEATSTGKGVFAVRPYPETAVIGEITGDVVHNRPHGSDYAFDLEEGLQLEPNEPFRYVNHSCDPNCEFDWIDEQQADGQRIARLYLIAARNIYPDEQLTIDYNWPASMAITCDCRSPLCRGWVVAEDQVGIVTLDRFETRTDMPNLLKTTSVFRIFDAARAREFYLDYLGFSIVFEHRLADDAPLYMGLVRDDVRLHLSEHHGDCCPGAVVRIEVNDIDEFHAELLSKNYKYQNPGIEEMPWDSREVSLCDPFGNRLVFFAATSPQIQP